MKTNVSIIHKPPTLQTDCDRRTDTQDSERIVRPTDSGRKGQSAIQADKGLGYTIRWCKEALTVRSGPSQIRLCSHCDPMSQCLSTCGTCTTSGILK